MDRDPGANQLDPIERSTPNTGENDTGDPNDRAARIMKDRLAKAHEARQVHAPAQTEQTKS